MSRSIGKPQAKLSWTRGLSHQPVIMVPLQKNLFREGQTLQQLEWHQHQPAKMLDNLHMRQRTEDVAL